MAGSKGMIALAVAASLPAVAFAQRPISPGNLPPGSPSLAAPFSGDAIPQGSPIPRILPPAPPGVGGAPANLPGLAAPGQVPNAQVTVRSVGVEGATAFNAAETGPLLAGLTGPAIPLQRIEAARTGLLNLYRSSGYVLTTVSARIDERTGALRFVVVEGRIAEVRLEGDIGPAGTQVLRFLNHLTELRPVDNASLERWLLLAQDVPGVTLRAVLRPSTAEPGALTLVAQIDRAPVNGLLSADNRAFRLTGPIEGVALLDLNSFTEFGERTEATFYHTDANTQNFGQLTEEAFIGGSGLRGRVYGGYGEANPSGFLRSVNYNGTTTVFGGSLTYPLIRGRQETLNLSGFFDAIETVINQTGTGAGSINRGFDSLRVARLGADYVLQDGLIGDDRPAITSVSVRLSQGIPSLGATSNGSASATRMGERVDFTKFVLDVSRVQTLFQVFTDSSIALRARAIGQVSSAVLPPSEQFFLGGSEYNRGYYSGEVTGDNAFVWQLEAQFNTSAEVIVFGRPINLNAQFYAFYDRGETWQNQKVDRNARLSSEGIGLRLNVTRFTEFDVEGDIRNTRLGSAATTTAAAVSPLKAEALFWRVITRF